MVKLPGNLPVEKWVEVQVRNEPKKQPEAQSPDGMTRTKMRRIQRKMKIQELQAQLDHPHQLQSVVKPSFDRPQNAIPNKEEGRLEQSEKTSSGKELLVKDEGPERKVRKKFNRTVSSSSSAASNMVWARLPKEFRAPAMRAAQIEEDAPSENEEVKAEFNFSKEEPLEYEKLPVDKTKHLKALMMVGKVNGKPVNRILVDSGATLNLVPYRYLKKLGMQEGDIVPTNVTLSDFTGDVHDAKGAITVELTIGSRTSKVTLFVIEADVSYNLLLGRDWIHTNQCVPSSLHQALAF